MAEKEYKERNAAIAKIKDKINEYPHNSNPYWISNDDYIVRGLREAIEIIDEYTPTADVQEVRHGKNVTPFHPADEFICSECGIAFKEMSEYIIEDDVYREFYFKFCPNCGAKMDKE